MIVTLLCGAAALLCLLVIASVAGCLIARLRDAQSRDQEDGL